MLSKSGMVLLLFWHVVLITPPADYDFSGFVWNLSSAVEAIHR
jgi:hypothetical protein